ncbi:DUF4468 domain-containing protein [Flavobacteriaceae bacterium]|nr:DUF4468 domain-containing protein [Flavobacteriaceae bacterium]
MKKLILLLLFIPLMSFGQSISKTNDGYTEVVEVELTKQQIHQKLNEWVAVSYKSAQDVIQLNSEDKIVLKGNFTINLKIHSFSFDYRINAQTTFSIRDNKYKIDLTPLEVTHISGNYDAGLYTINEFINDVQFSKDEYLPISINKQKVALMKIGKSEEKALKSAEKTSPKRLEKNYENYLINKSVWDSEISSTFTSIKDYVKQTNSDDDDW